MTITSADVELEFVLTARTKTGRDLSGWLKLVKTSGSAHRREIVQWLRQCHGLNHLQAQIIAGIFSSHGTVCIWIPLLH